MRTLSYHALAFFMVCICATAAGAAERPNVLLIMADDVGCDAIGCYGGASYPTPHIDKLAAGGIRFDNCYSMPSCHPTRTTLLTGRYPRRLGNPKWGSFPQNEERNTIAQVAKAAGYKTAVAGKWQLSLLSRDLDQPHRMGFDHYALFGWHEGPRYYQPLIFQDGSRRDDVADAYGPDVYSDALIDFMRRNKNERFFAYFPMALCHDVTDDLEQPVPYGPRGRYDSFAEMMAEMDRIVGKVITAVDELGLRENTVILFTGDNGTPMRSIIRHVKRKANDEDIDVDRKGYVRRPVYSLYNNRLVQGGKTQLIDAGTHVPLIVSWPGTISPEQVTDDLVDFSDFLPTIAELTGGEPPAGVTLDGHSFASRLTEGTPSPRKWAYAEARGKYWVRSKDFKLYDDGQFFCVKYDPLEAHVLKVDTPFGFTDDAEQALQQLQAALNSVKSFK